MTPEQTEDEIRKLANSYPDLPTMSYAMVEWARKNVFPERPGPSSDEIDSWERVRGIELPQTLRDALQVQDGGYVRGTRLVISPLGEMTPLSSDNWNHMWESEENRKFGEPGKLLLIGSEDVVGGLMVLDYNIGPTPRVLWLWRDLGDELRDEGLGDFDQFIVKLCDAENGA